jgi:hypothetical protein
MSEPQTMVQVLYWHGIPVQVKAQRGRGRRGEQARMELPPRFMQAVDAVAMSAGLTGTDAYLDGFIWGDPQPHDASPQDAATATAAQIEAHYPAVDWRKIAARLFAK